MTTTYKCPKCGGSDYFMSQRNVVKGMGWAQRGSIKSIPVCRVCDEIMEGAQIGSLSWEDLKKGDGKGHIPFRKVASKQSKKWLSIYIFSVIALIFIYASSLTIDISSTLLNSLFIVLISVLIFSLFKMSVSLKEDRRNYKP